MYSLLLKMLVFLYYHWQMPFCNALSSVELCPYRLSFEGLNMWKPYSVEYWVVLRIVRSDSFDSLKNLGSRCNPATLVVFINELAVNVVWEMVLQNQLFILSLILKYGSFLGVFNCTCCFVPVTNNQMKTKMNVATVVTQLRYGAFEWCMIYHFYMSTAFLFLHSWYCISVLFEARGWISDGLK